MARKSNIPALLAALPYYHQLYQQRLAEKAQAQGISQADEELKLKQEIANKQFAQNLKTLELAEKGLVSNEAAQQAYQSLAEQTLEMEKLLGEQAISETKKANLLSGVGVGISAIGAWPKLKDIYTTLSEKIAGPTTKALAGKSAYETPSVVAGTTPSKTALLKGVGLGAGGVKAGALTKSTLGTTAPSQFALYTPGATGEALLGGTAPLTKGVSVMNLAGPTASAKTAGTGTILTPWASVLGLPLLAGKIAGLFGFGMGGDIARPPTAEDYTRKLKGQGVDPGTIASLKDQGLSVMHRAWKTPTEIATPTKPYGQTFARATGYSGGRTMPLKRSIGYNR